MTSSGFGFQGEILVKLIKSDHSYVQVGVLGSETTNKSSVFRFRNLASVTRTVLKLVRLVTVLALHPTKNARSHDVPNPEKEWPKARSHETITR